LTCYGRIVITGMLPGTCHAAGMTSFLKAHHIRIFDYPHLRLSALRRTAARRIRENAEQLAGVIKTRGDHPGWCTLSRPWKRARRTRHGMTRPATKLSWGRLRANACTTISISSTSTCG
jgi:hypothetical protein